MNFLVLYVGLSCVALLGIITGSISILKPMLAIQIQQKFYAKINWKMEPISLSKEMRNTKIMGYISLILSCFIILRICSRF